MDEAGSFDEADYESVDAILLPSTGGLLIGGQSQLPSRRPKILLAAVCAVALLVTIAVQHARQRSDSEAAAGPVSSTSQPSPAPVVQPPSLLPVQIDVGSSLLDVPAGWQLFGRGPDSVVRIQLAAGKVTRTPLPGLSSSGPVSFLVGPSQMLIRPLDFVTGYLVPDGRPAQELVAPTMRAGPILPGPDRLHVWTPNASNSALLLTDWAGHPTGRSLPVPPVASYPDGVGYAVFDSVGGAYDAGPGGLHRVTTGAVIASGPTSWLTDDCDERNTCRAIVIDRATGHKRILNWTARLGVVRGTISPDGRSAALVLGGDSGLQLHLLDLRSGTDRTLDLKLPDQLDDSSMVWTPDGRWLFVAGASGYLSVVDVGSGGIRGLDVDLPELTQLAFRSD